MVSKYLLALLLCFLHAPVAAKEVDLTFPSSDEIRAAYVAASSKSGPIPDRVLTAFVAAEDQDFFDRSPLFAKITYQIARWYAARSRKHVFRVAVTMAIGKELTHQEILNWYASETYFGQDCFGVTGASQAYFGKPVSELRLEEYALLAAIIKAPTVFNPVTAVDRATKQRNFVLRKLRELEKVTEEQLNSALMSDLAVLDPLGRCDAK